jgi:Ricin-type beta-trefoil lectin domain-like
MTLREWPHLPPLRFTPRWLAVLLLLVLGAGCAAAPVTAAPDEPIAAEREADTDACTRLHRTTVVLGSDQRCGACADPYIEKPDRTCELAQTCEALGCGGPNTNHRICQTLPYPTCLDDCDIGYTWDEGERACRLPLTCDTLTCASGQHCVEGTDTTDAQCEGAACEPGKGVDTSGHCQSCQGNHSPQCDPGPGQTGNVLATASGRCVCETRPGYFVSTGNTGNAEPCDNDGDGWVNEGAQPTIEGNDAVLRSNARCNVHRIGKFVLQNEEGQHNEPDAENLAVRFPGNASVPPGLPLYESARNDGRGGQGVLPAPYGRIQNGKAINSLTKACLDAEADFDDNRIADVDQASNSAVSAGLDVRVGNNPVLKSYYAAYAKVSYFLELTDAWYVPPASGAAERTPGSYWIQERRRGVGTTHDRTEAAEKVPLRYAANTPPYWEQCRRATDVLYGAQAQSRVGGDFTDAALKPPAAGMNHHSQFKCVLVYDKSRYPSDASEAGRPQAFFVKDGKLARRDAPGSDTNLHLYNWTVNECRPIAVRPMPAGLVEANPLRVAISCTLPATIPSGPPSGAPVAKAAWAAVSGYEYAGPDGSVYQRGCVDQCKGGACANGLGSACSSSNGPAVCSCADGYTPLSSESAIKTTHFEACLAGAGAGGDVTQQSCDGSALQTWTFETALNGFQRIKNKQTGLCLAVSGDNSDNGAGIVQATCSDVPGQRFRAMPVDGRPNTYRFQGNLSGRCLQIQGGSVTTGAKLEQGECTGSAEAQFLVPASGTCTEIKACAYDGGGCTQYETCLDLRFNHKSCGDLDECAQDPGRCGSGFTCKNNDRSPPTCEDVKDCDGWNAIRNCGIDSRCVELIPGFRCDDIDECAENPGICGTWTMHRCINHYRAGYACADRNPLELPSHGGGGGNWFSWEVGGGHIDWLTIRYGARVDGIAIGYTQEDGQTGGVAFGGSGGTSAHTIYLRPEEYIIGIYGNASSRVDAIAFRIWNRLSDQSYDTGYFGRTNTPYYEDFPDPSFWVGTGFYGKAGTEIDQIGLIVR